MARNGGQRATEAAKLREEFDAHVASDKEMFERLAAKIDAQGELKAKQHADNLERFGALPTREEMNQRFSEMNAVIWKALAPRGG